MLEIKKFELVSVVLFYSMYLKHTNITKLLREIMKKINTNFELL